MLDTRTDTFLRATSRIAPLRRPVLERVSPQAAGIVLVGNEHGWQFKVLGRAPAPATPTYTGKWWITPAHLDGAQLPQRATMRAMVVYAEGCRPKQWLICHEVPKMLQAPAGEQKAEHPTPWWQRASLWLAADPRRMAAFALATAVVGFSLVQTGMGLAHWLGSILHPSPATAIAVSGSAAGTGAVAVVAGLGVLALADPVLVAVTEDNVWVEVDRWYN